MSVDPKQMIDAIKCQLQTNAGVVSITVDGQTIRYDRKQALDELIYWENKEKLENKTRVRSGQIRLDNAL